MQLLIKAFFLTIKFGLQILREQGFSAREMLHDKNPNSGLPCLLFRDTDELAQ